MIKRQRINRLKEVHRAYFCAMRLATSEEQKQQIKEQYQFVVNLDALTGWAPDCAIHHTLRVLREHAAGTAPMSSARVHTPQELTV